MAKYTHYWKGNFDDALNRLHEGILNGSATASYEGGDDFSRNCVRCAVRVYERYSMLGGNRVSLNLTLFGCGEDLSLSAMTSGGSQALFWKVNTFGEEAFLEKVREIVSAF